MGYRFELSFWTIVLNYCFELCFETECGVRGKNESICCCTEYKPKQPITNGDYLRICSVDSLAEFLWNYTHDVIGDYERIRNPILKEMPLKNILGDNCTKKEAWVEWLKQPHTPKE